MEIKDAIEKIQEELVEAGVSTPVSVELSLVLHEDPKLGVSVECLHSRSRRADHVHKVQFEVAPVAQSKNASEAQNAPTADAARKQDTSSSRQPAPQAVTPPELPDRARNRVASTENRSYIQSRGSGYKPKY